MRPRYRGADLVREIEPGEMVVIDGNGVRSFRIFKAEPARACVRAIYFSRLDSVVFGQSVDSIRRSSAAAGRRAPGRRRHRDLAPDSSNSAALGFSERLEIPLRARPDPEPLRRAHVHRATADHRRFWA
jgi:amidophosphoribosyltransferase